MTAELASSEQRTVKMGERDLPVQSSVLTSPPPQPQRVSRKPLVFVAVGVLAVALLVVGVILGARIRSSPDGAIEAPADGAVLTHQTAVSGWAIDKSAHGNTGVDAVTLYVDGSYVGDAFYGIGRTDIGEQFGLGYSASGWSIWLEPSQLGSGSHTLEARAHSTVSGQDTSYTRTIEVPEGTAPTGRLAGWLDTPENGAVISSLTDVRGWALDGSAAEGTGVDGVQLYLDGALVGDAQYGEPRPDVATQFGPQFANSGWTTRLDPSAFSVGPHTLEARVRSGVSGDEATYSTTIVIEQGTYPRGSLDTPTDGETVSGVIPVAGWAVDLATREGTGVDRVDIYIDGAQVATSDLGQTRPEIGAAYGQNFASSGWTAQVDLSQVSPGSHTLEARARSQLTGVETSYTAGITVD